MKINSVLPYLQVIMVCRRVSFTATVPPHALLWEEWPRIYCHSDGGGVNILSRRNPAGRQREI